MEKPTIAMVNGAAAGGGFDLALACGIKIGSENARFMVAFTRIGIVPGSGGTWLLPRIVGLPKACELIFTGDFAEAEEAYRIGLLNKLVHAERLEEETLGLAHWLAQGLPITHRLDTHYRRGDIPAGVVHLNGQFPTIGMDCVSQLTQTRDEPIIPDRRRTFDSLAPRVDVGDLSSV